MNTDISNIINSTYTGPQALNHFPTGPSAGGPPSRNMFKQVANKYVFYKARIGNVQYRYY